VGSEGRVILKVEPDERGLFLERIGRFLGRVRLLRSGEEILCHIHDPGRLQELLFKGNPVWLKRADHRKHRKTRYDLLSAHTRHGEVFVHSGYHSALAENLLIITRGKELRLRKEVIFGKSRIDFAIERNGKMELVEVKGCTLARGSTALFPDAPTKRGVKHLQELLTAVLNGYKASVIFLIFRREATRFYPNRETDPIFSETLRKCAENGVKIECHLLTYDPPFLMYLKTLREDEVLI
jgi:sugar fermentation stimulation protein A